MEMTLRWYGSKSDSVTLQQIRQIPGVTGIITTLYETAPGDLWKRSYSCTKGGSGGFGITYFRY